MSYVSVFLPAVQQLALSPLSDRTRKLTQLPSFAAYGVPLADLITGQCTSLELRSNCKVANTPSFMISPAAPRTRARTLLPSVRAHERRADGAGGASSAAKETAQLRGAAFEWSPLPPPVARGEWSRPRVFSRAAREDLGEICWVRRELGEQREAISVERRRRVVRREQAELAESRGGSGCAAAKNHHHDHFITQVWAAG